MKRILVVGCGSIGKRHITNFLETGECEIIGADNREDRLAEVKEKFGIKETHTDYREALKKGCDAMVVACPPHIHVPICLEGLEAGCHLFIEKPLAHNLDGLGELIKKCEAAGKVGFVAYCHRFIPYSLQFRELIQSGRIGKILSVRMEWGSYLPDWHPYEDYRSFYMAKKEQGGGALLDESHGVDLLRWWFGEIQSVSALVDQISHLEISSDDVASLLLKFESGATGTANFDLCRREPRIFVEAIGDEGIANWDRMANEIKCYDVAKKEWDVQPFTKDDLMSMYPGEVRHFLDCIDGKAQPLIDLEDGAKTMAVLSSAFEATANAQRCNIASVN